MAKKNCIDCGTILIIGKNWRSYLEENHQYICLDCKRKRLIKWRISRPNYDSKWGRNHRDKRRRNYERNYRKDNRKKINLNKRKSARVCAKRIKNEIFQLLGNKCSNPNCPIPSKKMDRRCLQIDHVYGGGSSGKNKSGRCTALWYRKILEEIKSGSKDYQLLCVYCNWLKRYTNKEIRVGD